MSGRFVRASKYRMSLKADSALGNYYTDVLSTGHIFGRPSKKACCSNWRVILQLSADLMLIRSNVTII